MSASWPVASHIALEPNVGFPSIAEVAGAFQDRETPARSRWSRWRGIAQTARKDVIGFYRDTSGEQNCLLPAAPFLVSYGGSVVGNILGPAL